MPEPIKNEDGMGNTTIAHRWYIGGPLNKNHDIKVSALQTFMITKNKNGQQISTITGVWITNLPINRSPMSL